MRLIKAFFLIIVLVVVILFFLQNSQELGQTVYLHFGVPGAESFEADSLIWHMPGLPVYATVLVAFLLGGLVALLSSLMTRIRMGAELRQAKRTAKKLEQEVNSLRKLPLQKNGQAPQGNGQQGGGQQANQQGNGQGGQQNGQGGQQGTQQGNQQGNQQGSNPQGGQS